MRCSCCATAGVRAPALARVNAKQHRVSPKCLRSILAALSNAGGTQFHQNGHSSVQTAKYPSHAHG